MTKKLILTQEQAEHAYISMKGVLEMRGKLSMEHPDYFVNMWNSGLVYVGIKDTGEKDTWHDFTYSSPDAFADAYAAHYGLTLVQSESTIDQMVREAQERLAVRLKLDVATHMSQMQLQFSIAYDRLLGRRGWTEYIGAVKGNPYGHLAEHFEAINSDFVSATKAFKSFGESFNRLKREPTGSYYEGDFLFNPVDGFIEHSWINGTVESLAKPRLSVDFYGFTLPATNEMAEIRTLDPNNEADYWKLLELRVKAKKAGNTLLAAQIKFKMNSGTFGKLAQSYSGVYDPTLIEKVTETGRKALRAMSSYKVPEKASPYGMWVDDESEGARPGSKVWKDYAPHLAKPCKRNPFKPQHELGRVYLEPAKSYWNRLIEKLKLNSDF